ncbi:MAG: polyketide synthase [Planctomycetota bacterium]|nr:MAG: polyketide synthase [Planctomycetota bacterium]
MQDLDQSERAIAVIGISCRVPGAKSWPEFWSLLVEGRSSLQVFESSELSERGVEQETFQNPNYVRANNVMEDVDKFDAHYFGMSPGEASSVDPQQRVFLEGAVHALNDAGHVPRKSGRDIGIFGGCGKNDYLHQNLKLNPNISYSELYRLMLANEKDFMTTRVAYQLGLTGPAISLNTACSTSLVAVHLACQSLLAGDCQMALAGGSCIALPQDVGYPYEKGMIFSRDGKCRPFDSEASGTSPGRGMGIVLLRPLKDAITHQDHIYAVIRGTAVNNDGQEKIGYTAPSPIGQIRVIKQALRVSGVHPESIEMVEAHGTGTPLGDPIEFEALSQAWKSFTQATGFCSIGSLKSNFGHAESAAGILGFIKVVLSLYHGMIPKTLHFRQPNPELELENSPFRVAKETKIWPSTKFPRRGAVSSFGMGGTNAHAVLEEAPRSRIISRKTPEPNGGFRLVPLSGKSQESVQRMAKNLKGHLENNGGILLGDISYTLIQGREEFPFRAISTVGSVEDLKSTLERHSKKSDYPQFNRDELVFVFPGQGSQYVRMAKDLYCEDAEFRRNLKLCADSFSKHLDWDLLQTL